MYTGAWIWECGDGSMGKGGRRREPWKWDHGDGSVETGAWRLEHDDGSMGSWRWEPGDGSLGMGLCGQERGAIFFCLLGRNKLIK